MSHAEQQLGKLKLKAYRCWVTGNDVEGGMVICAANKADAQRQAAEFCRVPEHCISVGLAIGALA